MHTSMHMGWVCQYNDDSASRLMMMERLRRECSVKDARILDLENLLNLKTAEVMWVFKTAEIMWGFQDGRSNRKGWLKSRKMN